MSTRDPKRLEAFERQADLPMLILSVIFTVLILTPWVWAGAAEHARVLNSLEWTIWGVFAVELAARVALAPDRPQYIARHWFDVAIVAFPFMRPLRILRGLRLLSVFARTAATWRRLLSRRGLQYVLAGGVGTIGAAAFLVARAESGQPNAPIEDFADALWWAVTTVTTVGYGDTYPTTPAGRGIGVALMLVGIGIFGLITANVAAFFVDEDNTSEHDELMAALHRIEERLERLEVVDTGARSTAR